MATATPGQIGHDQAAQLLRMSPAELTRLVGDGAIPRTAPGAYHPGTVIAAYIEHLRAEPARRERSLSQADIAEHLDISDRRVRELLTEWGIDHKRATLSDIRVRYIRKLREEAAGRASQGDLDLVQERAALARSQRVAQDMKNAVARGDFAPIGLLADVLGAASSAVVDRFDQLDGTLRKASPDLPEAARVAVQQVIASARNEWIRSTASLIEAQLQDMPDADDDIDTPVEDNDA